jgi:hypothetical protein
MQNRANFAVKNSDNEYIAIHDDDPCHIDFLKETIGFLEAKSGANYQAFVTIQA